MVGYTVNPGCIDEGFGPRNPLTGNDGIYGKAWGSPGCFCCKSHIHAWNMIRWWLSKRKIWFNPIYGWVLHGSPWLGWLVHMLIKALFPLYFMSIYILLIMWLWWLLYHFYYFGYMLVISMVLWQTLVMDLSMFWLVNKWLMTVWPNKWSCNYCEKKLYVLDDFHISMRYLCLNM